MFPVANVIRKSMLILILTAGLMKERLNDMNSQNISKIRRTRPSDYTEKRDTRGHNDRKNRRLIRAIKEGLDPDK